MLLFYFIYKPLRSLWLHNLLFVNNLQVQLKQKGRQLKRKSRNIAPFSNISVDNSNASAFMFELEGVL